MLYLQRVAMPWLVGPVLDPPDPVMDLQEGILLLVHGEVTDPAVDFFDREKVFIERHLKPLLQQLPDLKVRPPLTHNIVIAFLSITKHTAG